MLIFAAGVRHVVVVADTLRSLGQDFGTVFGNTQDIEREKAISAFKSGKLKILANVEILSTGFDMPELDCVAMLRPTMSPGLYYQMVGRGFRTHDSKEDCLILDFGGNVLRHGPVDNLRIPDGRRDIGMGMATAPGRPNWA